MHTRRPTAFTLIQLLVCLGILALAGVVVVAQFRVRHEEKVAWAVREVSAQLIDAQSRAIAEHHTQITELDPTAESHRLRDGLVQRQMLGASAPSSELSVARVSFDGQDAIAFDDLGAPYSYCARTHALWPLSVGAVVVTSGDARMTVRVLPITGKLQVQ